MSRILIWLSSYGAEYNIHTKVLYIRKPMRVKEFVALKKLLHENYKDKVKEIKVGL